LRVRVRTQEKADGSRWRRLSWRPCLTGHWQVEFSYNMSVNDDVSMSLIGNNVLNKRPPRDGTNGSYPHYGRYNYNAYGRAIMATLSWPFD
jgi:hypothetical protein